MIPILKIHQSLRKAAWGIVGIGLVGWTRLVAADSVSISDYGAVGDSRTDCTTPIQKALDKCGATAGGIVSVPTGHFLVKGHLTIPPSVTLEGVWQAPP